MAFLVMGRSARQPDPVRPVPGRRRLPRRRRMAAAQEGVPSLRAKRCVWPRSDPGAIGELEALAPGRRVRRDPAPRRRLVKRSWVLPVVLATGLGLFAVGMVVTGSSLDDARDRFLAARSVPVRLAVPAVDRQGAHRRRLVGDPRAGGRHHHGAARRRDRGAVPRQRERGRRAPGPGHEPRAPRRRSRERRHGGARRHPRIPRPQRDIPRGADARRRADGWARRLARPARRGRVRRRGDRADPADDRRRRARVPRPLVHRGVGLGHSGARCPRSSTSSCW